MSDTQLAPAPEGSDAPPPIDSSTPPADAPVLETPPQETPAPPPQAAPATPPPVSYEVKARALDMGWRPREEWNGHPDAWKPADEFVRRGDEVLPIVRARATRAEAEVAQLRGNMADMARTFDDRLRRIDNVSQVALRRQAQQIGAYYEDLKRQAVEAGDTARYDQVDQAYRQELGELHRQAEEAYAPPAPDPRQPPPPAQVDPQIDRTIRDWVGQQEWWNHDPVLTKAAVEFHGAELRTNPNQSVADNLKATERFLAWKYPHRFPQKANGHMTQPPAAQPPAQPAAAPHAPGVEGGARHPAGANRPKGWNELPPEAKQAHGRFVTQGLYTDDQKGRGEYATDYWAQPD